MDEDVDLWPPLTTMDTEIATAAAPALARTRENPLEIEDKPLQLDGSEPSSWSVVICLKCLRSRRSMDRA